MSNAVDSPTLALLLAAVGTGFGALASLIATITLAKFNHLTAETKELGKTLNSLFNAHTVTVGHVAVHAEAIKALQEKTLTRERFEDLTREQNEKLVRIERDVTKTSEKVDNIDRGLIQRSGYSVPEMPAAKQPYRPLPR